MEICCALRENVNAANKVVNWEKIASIINVKMLYNFGFFRICFRSTKPLKELIKYIHIIIIDFRFCSPVFLSLNFFSSLFLSLFFFFLVKLFVVIFCQFLLFLLYIFIWSSIVLV